MGDERHHGGSQGKRRGNYLGDAVLGGGVDQPPRLNTASTAVVSSYRALRCVSFIRTSLPADAAA